MEEKRVQNAGWIEGKLDDVEFVEWDRFTISDWFGQQQHVTVYGWIDRDDEYKDFVLVVFWPEIEQFYFTTSSKEYTKEVYERLVGESPKHHNECNRVEDTFNVENAIELEAKA